MPARRTPGGGSTSAPRPATTRSRSSPARPRPVSTSRWIRSARRGRGPGRPPGGLSRGDRPFEQLLARGGDGDVEPHRLGTTAGGTAYRHRIGQRRPPARSSTASSKAATDRPSAPGRLERPRDRHGAVPVGVGLDHGLDPDAGRQTAARSAREVAAQPVEVDLEPGRPGKRRQAGRGEAALDRRPCAAGHDGRRTTGRRGPRRRTPSRARAAAPLGRRRPAACGRGSISIGRSEASSPASPSRSRRTSPAAPWR